MIRRIAVVMGLLAFAVTIFGGLLSSNRFEFILAQALWAMCIFYALGAGVGWAGDHVLREYRAKQHDAVLGPGDGADTGPNSSAVEKSSTAANAQPIQN